MLSILSFTALCSLATSVVAVPTFGWEEWHSWKPQTLQCNRWNVETRVDFASMPLWERKSYTDAVKCLMSKPSQLDKTKYPAAVNRYVDYAVIHVSKTQQVHLSGFFLVWHRHFNYLYYKDLKQTCGYRGRLPYWDFGATAGDLVNSAVFDGSAYSMSGNGEFKPNGPIPLGPSLVIPQGTGGGCVTSGPFANMKTTLAFVPPLSLVTGQLPPNLYAYSEGCLTRDLNPYVAQQFTNSAKVAATARASDAANLELLFNAVIGGNSLGVHSGAHFQVGGANGQMSSIHVSPQDPIWYPMHVFVDAIYASYQINNPGKALDQYGTMTALNRPPTANVTLDSIVPDWGYFEPKTYTVRDLSSTTSGPYCYQYDKVLG